MLHLVHMRTVGSTLSKHFACSGPWTIIRYARDLTWKDLWTIVIPFPEEKVLNSCRHLLHASGYQKRACFLSWLTILCMKKSYYFQSLLSKQFSNVVFLHIFFFYLSHKYRPRAFHNFGHVMAWNIPLPDFLSLLVSEHSLVTLLFWSERASSGH